MEKRRNIPVKLNDGKEYLFSERNKEDSDFAALQDRVRKHNMRLIQDSVTDPEERLTLLAAEMRREYSIQMVLTHIMSDTRELLRIAYDSFKIENKGIDFNDFKELFPIDHIELMGKMLDYLEGDMKPNLYSVKKKRKGLFRLFHTKLQFHFS